MLKVILKIVINIILGNYGDPMLVNSVFNQRVNGTMLTNAE